MSDSRSSLPPAVPLPGEDAAPLRGQVPTATPTRLIRKVVKHALRIGLLGIVVGYVGSALWQRLSQVDWAQTSVIWSLVMLALALSTVGSGLPLVSLRCTLRNFTAEQLPWLPLASAAWLPALGKYVPGKIATFAGSFWMLRQLNILPLTAALTSFWLNGLAVIVGLLLAVPLTFWQPVRDRMPLAGATGIVLLIGGVCSLHPKVIGTVGSFILRKLKYPAPEYLPCWKHHAAPLGVLLVQFVIQGIALWCLAKAFSDVSVNWLPAFISINALALSVGFLALFAPGGIGVREGILLLVLSLATPSAALIVVAMRAIHLLGELILAGLGAAILFSPLWKNACQESLRRSTETSLAAPCLAPAPTGEIIRAA